MLGAMKLHNEVTTVMSLYALNTLTSKQIFKNYTCKKQTDRKTLEFRNIVDFLSCCHVKQAKKQIVNICIINLIKYKNKTTDKMHHYRPKMS